MKRVLFIFVYLVTSANLFAQFGGGDGSLNTPYLIATPAHVQELAAAVNSGTTYSGKYFLQTANLDFKGLTFTAIGNYNSSGSQWYYFKGIYDGGGKKISNFYDTTGYKSAGFFGAVYDATLKNIGIFNAKVQSSSTADPAVGALVGFCDGTTTVSSCYSEAYTVLGKGSTGGLIGRASAGTITSCYSSGGSVTGYGWAGGLIGENLSMNITGCFAVNTVQNSNDAFNMSQTISDEAQRNTLAFSAFAMMTGNLQSQTFFPPGKVADYTGFQYLRDNDADDMGHNTSFLTRVSYNMIYMLTDAQFAQLKVLATAQMSQIDQYGYMRFPLMKAFRRMLSNEIPAGSSGLNLNSVKKASREMYIIDGQISFDRAVLYSNILNSLSADQQAYIKAMMGNGWGSWPEITNDQIKSKMSTLTQGTAVAVMTYAGDLFSWYAGSVDADVYFCPERHGTYFGSFYMKDAPAIGHEGYGIDEQMTAVVGSMLVDASQGYVTASQATLMSSLVETQRNNLYAGTSSIVSVRAQIATLLRKLLFSMADSAAIRTQVLSLSSTYGELDGENNYHYASVISNVYNTMSSEQKTRIDSVRHKIMSGTYSDGTPFDFYLCNTYYLYSNPVTADQLSPYISNTDYLFFEPTSGSEAVWRKMYNR